ncbi:AraC family transcriptional regulator [Halolactibacillus sp. JCM 19043]|uniref:AraC family transcriptional regulator n=1 Tax=Halolactibacillus sp. JCM 19043 TaxID=1460638 RepID=UPI0007854379|nr:AraC family transcriptional regulator [Halolactibacillus sp. JCM 19043]
MNTRIQPTLQFKEQTQHGNKGFPLQLYQNITHYEKGLIFHNHWHDEAELFYVKEGDIDLVINEVSFVAKEQTIVLIPPNIIHGAYLSSNKKCQFSSIVFHPDFIASKRDDKIQTTQLEPFLNQTFLPSYVINQDDHNSQALIHLLHAFEKSYQNRRNYAETEMKGYLFLMLYQILEGRPLGDIGIVPNDVNEERKKNILTFISAHYQDDINLETMAKVLSLSKEQFCRFFKQSFHSTPMQYVTQFRLKRAMEQLKYTDSPIIDIALDVGFDSSNYFSIVFKKVTGITPTHYRKMTRSSYYLT